MVIEHIDWLMESLCSVKELVTYKEYERSLIEISSGNVIKSTSDTDKSIQMYLYWLTTLVLLEGDRTKNYSISPIGKKLCEYRKKNKIKYQTLLRDILLTNKRVGYFFNKYKEKIEERTKQLKPITRNEIKSFFKTQKEHSTGAETERILFKFSQEAGMVTETKDGYLAVKLQKPIEITPKKFKKAVIDAYNSIVNRIPEFHLKKIYVEIYKVRSIVVPYLGMTYTEFDKSLTDLLKSKEGKHINIYPAAPQWFTERIPERKSDEEDDKQGLKTEDVSFRFEEKIYVFMSILKK